MNKRINQLRKVLTDKKLDGVLITSRPNTLYLSGFPGSASTIFISHKRAIFLTDFRYIEFSKKRCGNDYEVMLYEKNPLVFLLEQIKNDKISKIGFEDQIVSYASYLEISEQLDGIELIGLKDEITKLRLVKENGEIKTLQKAVDIADQAFTHILKYIKVGISEIDIAAEIEHFMRKNGAEKQSFDSIVASGKRSSLPHGHATDKLIEPGDGITMDFGAIYNGYCSDMTRTVFIGKPEQKILDIYATVFKAQTIAEDAVHSGKTGMEIDKIARDIIYDAGYEGMFGHGLGHGVGIEVHEEPRLSTTGNIVLENGMVVTVEPGIYAPNYGGVRIEDMVVVNDDLPKVLTSSKKELIIL
ncbi:MAG: aminopeptidase P family protein [Clostridiales bacterium]|nr:aminopeptidase P family protein [Clostridiales bacterium]